VIPIAKPIIGDREKDLVRKVLDSGNLNCGQYTTMFEAKLAQVLNLEHTVAVSSGTAALLIAYMALGLKQGDKVLTTPFTFYATASCLKFLGVTPIFVDVDPYTFNISPDAMEKKLQTNEGIKAVVIVHLYGLPCDMDNIMTLVRKYNLLLVEDCAQAMGSEYSSNKVGTFGDMATFSFYPTKHITTGEGGLVATNNLDLANKARLLRNHGQSKKYYHTMLGLNFRMSDLNAAIGLAQLERFPEFIASRRSNAEFYKKEINNCLFHKPIEPAACYHTYHQYTLVSDAPRQAVIEHLEQHAIGYGIHYPLTLQAQPVFREHAANCPTAEELANRVFSIPVHPSLSQADLEAVADCLNNFGR